MIGMFLIIKYILNNYTYLILISIVILKNAILKITQRERFLY